MWFNRLVRQGTLSPVLYNTEDDGGGGGGTGGSGSDGDRQRVEATVRRIMQEGRTEDKLVQLHLDNHDLRAKLREAEGRTAVPDGGKVLTAEESKAWEEYQAMGKPEEVKAKVEERDTLRQEVDQRKEQDRAAEAARLAGFKPTVLADLIQAKGLEMELKDTTVTEDGNTKTVKVPHVRPKGQESTAFSPLQEYVQTNLADYLPALQANEAGGQGGASGGNGGPGPVVTPYPAQQGGGKPAKSGVLDEFMEGKKKRAEGSKSPLDAPTTSTATS